MAQMRLKRPKIAPPKNAISRKLNRYVNSQGTKNAISLSINSNPPKLHQKPWNSIKLVAFRIVCVLLGAIVDPLLYQYCNYQCSKNIFLAKINVAVICYRHKRHNLFPINSKHRISIQKEVIIINLREIRQIPKFTRPKKTILAKINVTVNLHRRKRQKAHARNSKHHYFHQNCIKKA